MSASVIQRCRVRQKIRRRFKVQNRFRTGLHDHGVKVLFKHGAVAADSAVLDGRIVQCFTGGIGKSQNAFVHADRTQRRACCADHRFPDLEVNRKAERIVLEDVRLDNGGK